LIRLIGHGGMGAVYLGIRDDDQYQKQVAIKLLKRGMDTDFMLNRFRQERQILANLEHPFIARLIDGGATEDGLPYFVMEYVDGVPITKYCEGKNLSIPERVRLFRLVCEAVQHAHQNLVVHRDIKPSNILTTREGIPKLLDFGIAKVLDPGVASEVTFTQREFRMLTPDYASPEQVKGLPISTASDTYSLGAVLYELLSGTRPHQFPSESLADLETTICQTETVKPSVAARKELRRQLAGDLDNIVLTAMRKEPPRRYASPAEFSEDLRRHLEGLPILAHEDRWGYRAGKFVRRNRLAVGAATLLAASLIGGIVTTTVQARRAERRFQLVRRLGNIMLFELQDEMARLPGTTALRASTVRTVVKYLDDLAQDGAHDPGLEMEIAAAYERAGHLEGHPYGSNLGRGAEALVNFNKALVIYQRHQNDASVRVRAIRGLIETHLKLAQMEALHGSPSKAAPHFQQATQIAKEVFARDDHGLPPITQVNLYYRLADAAYEHGSGEGELAMYRKALEIALEWHRTDRNPSSISAVLDSYKHVGNGLARSGDLARALESYRRGESAAAELAQRGDAEQDQTYSRINLANDIGDLLAAEDDPHLGDRAAALVEYQKALTSSEALAASDLTNVNARRYVAFSSWRLGMYWSAENPKLAEEHCRRSIRISEELGSNDPRNAEYKYQASRGYLWLGYALHNLRRYDDAVKSLNRAVELQKTIEAVSPERVWNLRVLSRALMFLGGAHLEGGDPQRALDTLKEALETADRMLQRAPASLYHQLDRADVLEALGAYFVRRAGMPGAAQDQRTQFRRQARSRYQESLSIWRTWTALKIGAPYAGRRERQANTALATIPLS
jgi:tetratricopeptide (TPR) repeat protein